MPHWRSLSAGPSPRARGKQQSRRSSRIASGTIPAGAGETDWHRLQPQLQRDHPRGRGGNRPLGHRPPPHRGPSPRARGKQIAVHALLASGGTIPAGAGETPIFCGWSCGCGDHPRGRGGNRHCRHIDEQGEGPSPRARGKLTFLLPHRTRRGTIPAGAGETGDCARGGRGGGDHPRGRGGNIGKGSCCLAHWGPSPRARGKLRRRTKPHTCLGTIPAGAGETARLCGQWDHPRGRGGNALRARCNWSKGGPSPRARGKLISYRRSVGDVGTIPAGAGETGRRAEESREAGDHPRGRGGNAPARRCPAQTWGPSPRARGKLVLRKELAAAGGTIPAGAGETDQNRSRTCSATDHPRGRGGNAIAAVVGLSLQGPSPRARGKPVTHEPRRADHGTIPAGAGETLALHFSARMHRDHPRGRGGNSYVGIPHVAK